VRNKYLKRKKWRERECVFFIMSVCAFALSVVFVCALGAHCWVTCHHK
jgi:hypothetical protein